MNDVTETPKVSPVGNWYRLIEMPQLYGGNPHLTIGRYYLVDAVEGSNFWLDDNLGLYTSFGSARFDLAHPVVLPSEETVQASQEEWRAWHAHMTIERKWSVWEGGSRSLQLECRLLSDGSGWYLVLDARSPPRPTADATDYWLVRTPILGTDTPDPGGMWPMGLAFLKLLLRARSPTSAPNWGDSGLGLVKS